MCNSEDQNTVYQGSTGGLIFTANLYSRDCLIEKEASDKNLVIIILDGDGIVTVPSIGSCRAGKGQIIFIPADTPWIVEILKPGQTLEIQFADLNNFYCESYFRSLLPLCDELTHELTPLYSCSAIDDYVDRILQLLYYNQDHDLSNDYELFVLLGVYYPRSRIANFLYPFIKTLVP